jgi:hypothetical protein
LISSLFLKTLGDLLRGVRDLSLVFLYLIYVVLYAVTCLNLLHNQKYNEPPLSAAAVGRSAISRGSAVTDRRSLGESRIVRGRMERPKERRGE